MARPTDHTAMERVLQKMAERFSGQLGFAATNLATGEAVAIGADRVFPTASTIKLPILVELFRQVDAGQIDLADRIELRQEEIVGGSGILKELTPGLTLTLRDVATLMIVLSDNTATNLTIDCIGGVEAVNETMHDRLGLPSITLHNRIDFARIGDDVRRFAESTPHDMARLVALIVRGEAVSPTSCDAVLRILRRQQYLDQVPRYLGVNPYAAELGVEPDIWVANKTGFFPGSRVDTGAIGLPHGVTIAYCAMNEGSRDQTFSAEAEGAVTNGLLGQLIVAYWWPGDRLPPGVLLASPYLETATG